MTTGNPSATRGMKIRLTALGVAIAAMVGLVAWTAHSSWLRTGELQEKLTAVQLQSFLIADHFQQTILELNTYVQRFGIYHETNDWNLFESGSKKLDAWIDDQRPILSSENEKAILDEIATNYDFYVAAARDIETNALAAGNAATPLAQFANFEKQSQQVLSLAFQLATAHRESMDSFLADSKKALTYLRVALLNSLVLLLLAGGGLAVVVYRDLISPLRVKLVESQALAERQEKLASLGMLAAGVAHEIRNPLTAIKAWLFIQQKHLRAGTPEYEDSQVIGGEIERLERIVKEVLLFARPSEPHFVTTSVEQCLREAETLLTPELMRSNVRLMVEGPMAGRVRVDPQQIKQVLINLIQNASESIGRDGMVTLRSRQETRRLLERETPVVILEVADTGSGIKPEVEKRLFDPFFTTKEDGTGLGLSIAARIIEKHGGALQYQTRVNRGTTFGIVLPLTES